MRLASRLVPPPHAAHPPRRLHPALRSRCAPSFATVQKKCIIYTVVGAHSKFIRMKSTSKKRTPSIVNLTVKRRYLTEREVERLMGCARKCGRYGHRDATMILIAYRHGLRASEVSFPKIRSGRIRAVR
jgi:integrase